MKKNNVIILIFTTYQNYPLVLSLILLKLIWFVSNEFTLHYPLYVIYMYLKNIIFIS